jgi:hypothetical protein
LTQLTGPEGSRCGGVNLCLIVADFAPIIDELASEASRVFHEGSTNFMRQARALTFGPIDAAIEKVSLALQDPQARPHEDTEANIHAIRESIANLKPASEARPSTLLARAAAPQL